jgi:hypothetical protein
VAVTALVTVASVGALEPIVAGGLSTCVLLRGVSGEIAGERKRWRI